MSVVSTVWFTIGGTVDLRRLFKRLKANLETRQTNILDDGRVIGHVAAADVTLVKKVEDTAKADKAEP